MQTMLKIAAGVLIVAPTLCHAQGQTAGLLGKNYVRGAYTHMNIDAANIERFDSSLQGFDVEVNTPLTFLTNNSIATDFYSEFDYSALSGTSGGNSLKTQFRTAKLGVRLFSPNASTIRPYIGLGVGIYRSRARANWQTLHGSEDSFLPSLGFEADLTEKLATRHDVDLPVSDLDLGSYEGTLIYWPTDGLFLRGGVTVPFDEGLEIGGTIGAGIAF